MNAIDVLNSDMQAIEKLATIGAEDMLTERQKDAFFKFLTKRGHKIVADHFRNNLSALSNLHEHVRLGPNYFYRLAIANDSALKIAGCHGDIDDAVAELRRIIEQRNEMPEQATLW